MTFKEILAAAAGKAGKALTTVGTKLTPGVQLVKGGAGAALQNWASPINQLKNLPLVSVAKAYDETTPQVNWQGAKEGDMTQDGTHVFKGGQWVATSTLGANDGFNSGGGSNGGSNGTAIDLNAPIQDSGQSEGDVINSIKPYYDQAKSEIERQNPVLDSTYNLAKSDIQGGIDDTVKSGEKQKGELNLSYGDILKNQLQNYQDLNRQRMGTFSALGSLDSSSFGEQQFRADQSLSDQRGRTEVEKVKSVTNVDDQVESYKKKANGELSRLAIQYQSGKNAVADAIARNDLASASAIQGGLQELKSRAVDIQNKLLDFANSASLLKAQGYDVKTNISGVSASPYANEVSKQLANMMATGRSTYTLPSNSSTEGQGYLAPNGKKYNSRDEYLRAIGQVQ